MLGFGKKAKVVPAPLWDFLAKFTPEKFAAHLDKESRSSDDGSEFLRQLILGATYVCVGDFVRGAGDFARKGLGKVAPDVIAFEALSFCIYNIRENHLPTPEDPLDDDENETLVNAYRDVIYMTRLHIEKFTGWDVTALWNRRIMFHFQRKDVMEATEAFVGRLLSMTDAQVPTVDYGPMSLDIKLNTDIRMHVHAFASNVPKGCAEAIENVVSEFSLAD
jgi:hypothetical protein